MCFSSQVQMKLSEISRARGRRADQEGGERGVTAKARSRNRSRPEISAGNLSGGVRNTPARNFSKDRLLPSGPQRIRFAIGRQAAGVLGSADGRRMTVEWQSVPAGRSRPATCDSMSTASAPDSPNAAPFCPRLAPRTKSRAARWPKMNRSLRFFQIAGTMRAVPNGIGSVFERFARSWRHARRSPNRPSATGGRDHRQVQSPKPCRVGGRRLARALRTDAREFPPLHKVHRRHRRQAIFASRCRAW